MSLSPMSAGACTVRRSLADFRARSSFMNSLRVEARREGSKRRGGRRRSVRPFGSYRTRTPRLYRALLQKPARARQSTAHYESLDICLFCADTSWRSAWRTFVEDVPSVGVTVTGGAPRTFKWNAEFGVCPEMMTKLWGWNGLTLKSTTSVFEISLLLYHI